MRNRSLLPASDGAFRRTRHTEGMPNMMACPGRAPVRAPGTDYRAAGHSKVSFACAFLGGTQFLSFLWMVFPEPGMRRDA